MILRTILIVMVLLVGRLTAHGNEFVWFDGKQAVSYSLPAKVAPVVTVAMEMWQGDLQQVTGWTPVGKSVANATVRIVQLNEATGKVKKELKALGVPVDELATRKDGFYLAVAGSGKKQLLVVGADGRGTAYGILELSRLAGVSPWVWWSDVTPRKQSKLAVAADYKTMQSPSVEYRGIFLNDEDWSLQPWSWKHFEPNEKMGYMGPRTYKEIFKLLMRLRANAIWPGMHGISVPFYWVKGAKEAADSCGIAIGTSHCEPLMCNINGEWRVEKYGEYNYLTNRETIQNYWIERLKMVAPYENMYTIGMRGVHDSGMEGVNTMEEKVNALQQVINDQRGFLKKYVNKEVTEIPQMFVPYKEVLEIMENGLEVPDDVTLMWCDDNYGYMTRLSDEEQQKRKGGAGVYYHLSYWGRPHDYMWLCTTQPGLVYHEMKQAYDHNARKVWIVNVHDLKPVAYDLELFLDMAWDIESIQPSTLNNHLEQWLCREFGEVAGKKLLSPMQEFYRLCGIRKPEFMGWTQVELDKNKVPRGRSQVIDTEFSLTEFGGELDRYLEDYARIKQQVAEIETLIPADRKDTYYSHIKYQVFGAAAMAVKMLEAQRARTHAFGQCNEELWTRTDALLEACAKSADAYQEIRRLTDYYNNEMAGGRWKYSMCHNPRDLHVFNTPILPIGLTEKEVAHHLANAQPTRPHPIKADNCIARNACRYTTAGKGVHTIQSLGHSMKAVSLPKGESLTYEFDCPYEGEALLHTAVIPTQPNDKGDIRFSVSIDGEAPQVISFREKGRTDTWKINVLRGQAVKKTKHTLGKGKHTLTITALDNHVVVDQWMLDFTPDRKFYVFPLEGENR